MNSQSDEQATQLGPTEVARLAFIKQIHRIAIEQSEAAWPQCAVSILTFHDAIELFNQLAVDFLDADTKKDSFMSYWSRISKALPGEGARLPMESAVQKLNRARVSLKHHGIMPAESDIETFRGTAAAFFEEGTPIVFGVSFGSLSLIDFVRPVWARDELHCAIKSLEDDDLLTAAKHIGCAFYLAVQDYDVRKQDGRSGWRSPFEASESDFGFGLPSSHSVGRSHGEEMAQFVDGVKQELNNIRAMIKILALGIDFRKYVRFTRYVSEATPMLDGSLIANHPPWEPDKPPSPEELHFCIDFVIETALHFSAFDYTVENSEVYGDTLSEYPRIRM